MDSSLYESLTEGDFGSNASIRNSLLEGDFWTRKNPLTVITRDSTRETKIKSRIVTEQSGNISTNQIFSHDYGVDYYYSTLRISCHGQIEHGPGLKRRFNLDDTFSWPGPSPNSIWDCQVVAVGNEQVEVCWWYSAAGQDAVPNHFEVYLSDDGHIDFDLVAETVVYHGQGFYKTVINVSAEVNRYFILVHSVTRNGVHDNSRRMIIFDKPIELEPCYSIQISVR